jgi:hypothetical protein
MVVGSAPPLSCSQARRRDASIGTTTRPARLPRQQIRETAAARPGAPVMLRWEFAVRVPFAALLPFLAARACVIRFCGVTNCYATTTVSTSISLQISPTTGVGGGASRGACCPRRAADPSAASCRRIQPVLNASRFNRVPPGPSGDSLANFEHRSMTASSGGWTTAGESGAHSSPTEGTGSRLA